MKIQKLRDSAKGEQCTLNVAGVCNYNSETTVLCHIKTEGGQMAGKPADYSACFGCSDCHDFIDRRAHQKSPEHKFYDFYTQRALVRTWKHWIEMGLAKFG